MHKVEFKCTDCGKVQRLGKTMKYCRNSACESALGRVATLVRTDADDPDVRDADLFKTPPKNQKRIDKLERRIRILEREVEDLKAALVLRPL
jgi:hypothetical protein